MIMIHYHVLDLHHLLTNHCGKVSLSLMIHDAANIGQKPFPHIGLSVAVHGLVGIERLDMRDHQA